MCENHTTRRMCCQRDSIRFDQQCSIERIVTIYQHQCIAFNGISQSCYEFSDTVVEIAGRKRESHPNDHTPRLGEEGQRYKDMAG